MKSITRLLAAASIAFLAFQVPSIADDDDSANGFGTRYSVGLDKKIVKGLHFTVDEEVRLDGFSSLDRMYTSAGISYKVCPYLKVGLGYSAINVRKIDDDDPASMSWDWRHRGTFDLTGMVKTGGWKFSLRERFQATYKTREVSEWEQPRTALALKSRYKASYTFRRSGLEPFVSIEHRLLLNGAKWDENSTSEFNFRESEYLGLKDVYTNRLRSQFGLTWNIDKRHAVEIYGLHDNIWDKAIDSKKSDARLKVPVTESTRRFMAVGLGYCFSF